MAIMLYEHNREAYERAMDVLEKEGKAAIIHPTGTGKSMIGFKLCEDHAHETVCWLSPSKYVFATQIENLAKSSDGYQPDNIKFFTYARLMNLTEGELAEIQPDYIVLDEFHRCGAQAWGEGVDRLLGRYADVPLLGLSATAVRFLDNQRDMSDEIFDGHIASEMSLGEAIVRGILNPPKYVLSIYSYQEELDKYEQRIRRLKNRQRRDRAEEHLEQLRRIIDQAEGLEEIFDRHMTDRTGKYIVFCSGYEAMQDALGKAGEWFCRVDKEPHIYSVYSDDPSASREFEDYKNDQDTTHMRLLFCIDALNEGIHVDDVSGVILLRPTVSPIVYKQQIGRALSASRRTEPVIFDIVNNIENLYSIDAVQDEMNEALYYMRESGGEEKIVNETFRIIDELSNCLALFEELENTLTASWDVMFLEARRYYEEKGDLLLPLSYMTDTGYALGRWVHTQRVKRRNGISSLTGEKIAALDSIGMDWRSADDRTWKAFYEAACEYYTGHGNLDIPATYETKSGVKLGRLYRGVRKKYMLGKLPDERIEALEKIGMKWNSVLIRKWMQYYELAKEFYEENGNLNIPHNYVVQGQKLGIWISSQRESYAKGRLSDEQVSLLEAVGMSWNRFESKWERGYQCCLRYIAEHGDINNVPDSFAYDGFRLNNWLRTQRSRKRAGKLTEERIERLTSIGFHWDVYEAFWRAGYKHACVYLEEHGNLKMPVGYVCEDGFKLKSWLNNQSTRKKKGLLSEEQLGKLRAIGCV